MTRFLNARGLLRACQPMIRPVAVLLLTLLPMSPLSGAVPAWWYQREMVTGFEQDDYAALNAGQLKNAVRAGVDEMNAKLSGGAGQALNDLVASWQAGNTTADNEVAVNQGQVMAVVKLWYDRLNEVHDTAGYYPWNGATPDDYAIANVGQLKNLLARDVTVPPNADHSAAPSMVAAAGDADSDGLPLWAEILLGTDPDDADSDDDTLNDGDEDADADEVTNALEVQYGWNPKSALSVAPLTFVIVSGQNGFAMAGEVISGLQVRLTRRLDASNPVADIPAPGKVVSFTASTGGLREGTSGGWSTSLNVTTNSEGLAAVLQYQTSTTPGATTVVAQVGGATTVFNLVSDVDTDGDGYGDYHESTTGGDPADPLVLPNGVAAENPASFTLTWQYSTRSARTMEWEWEPPYAHAHSQEAWISAAPPVNQTQVLEEMHEEGAPPAITTVLAHAEFPSQHTHSATIEALSGASASFHENGMINEENSPPTLGTYRDKHATQRRIRVNSSVPLPAGCALTVIQAVEVETEEGETVTYRSPLTFVIPPNQSRSNFQNVEVPTVAAGESASVNLLPVRLRQENMPNQGVAQNTTDMASPYGTATINAGGIAYITGEPAMPKLKALVPGLTSSASVAWKMEIKSERTNRGTKDDKKYPASGYTTVAGNVEWDIWSEFGSDFVGGKCKIFYKVDGGSERTFEFLIRGKNPKDADAKTYVQNHAKSSTYPYAWGIVQHESRQGSRAYNQFNSGGDGPGNLETPNFGAPDGWGISQLDMPLGVSASTMEVYQWKQNVEKFFLELDEKEAATNRFFAAVIRTYPNDPDAAAPPTAFAVPGTTTFYTAQQLSTMVLYNGAAGTTVSTLVNEGGQGTTNYTNPWSFDPNRTPKWQFQANSNNYAFKVVHDEIEGGSTVNE